MTTQENEWREQFDKTFYEGERNSVCCKKHKAFATPIEIKTFIQNLLTTHSAHLVERISDMAIVDDYGEERKTGFQIAKDKAIDIINNKNEWVEEGVFRLLAKHFPNGNHGDYVDWINTDAVIIDGTYDLETLAEDIQTLLDQHSAHLVERTKKEIYTEMKEIFDTNESEDLRAWQYADNKLQAIDIVKNKNNV